MTPEEIVYELPLVQGLQLQALAMHRRGHRFREEEDGVMWEDIAG